MLIERFYSPLEQKSGQPGILQGYPDFVYRMLYQFPAELVGCSYATINRKC